MYGAAVYERFSGYWTSYQAALQALVASRGPQLQELSLEAPARCLGQGLVTRRVCLHARPGEGWT